MMNAQEPPEAPPRARLGRRQRRGALLAGLVAGLLIATANCALAWFLAGGGSESSVGQVVLPVLAILSVAGAVVFALLILRTHGVHQPVAVALCALAITVVSSLIIAVVIAMVSFFVSAIAVAMTLGATDMEPIVFVDSVVIVGTTVPIALVSMRGIANSFRAGVPAQANALHPAATPPAAQPPRYPPAGFSAPVPGETHPPIRL